MFVTKNFLFYFCAYNVIQLAQLQIASGVIRPIVAKLDDSSQSLTKVCVCVRCGGGGAWCVPVLMWFVGEYSRVSNFLIFRSNYRN